MRLSAIGYEPTLLFLMCDTSLYHRYILFPFQLTIYFILPLLVPSLVLFHVHCSMPVTTRSQTRGGLRDTAHPVPLPLCSLTCINAISSTVETTTKPTIDASINSLSELVHPAPLSLLSSEVNCRLKLDSSLDSHFENLIFSNFEIPICSTDSNSNVGCP